MDSPAPKARRNLQPNKEQLILDAAIQVFAEKGYARATVKDIARHAGIADGTLYTHYPNKAALLLAILNRVNQTDERVEHFQQARPDDLESFIQGYFQQRLDIITPDSQAVLQILLSELPINPELRTRYREEITGPTFQVAEAALAHWQAAGAIETSDLPLTARALAALLLGSLVLRVIGDPVLEERWDDLPATLTALALHGLKGDRT